MSFEPAQSMKPWLLFLAITLLSVVDVVAQLEVVAGGESQRLFGGGDRLVNVLINNRSDKALSLEALVRLVQTSSATAIRLSESPWKRLEVLPKQTVVERALVPIPTVGAETRFLVQWCEGTNKVIGTTEVMVYPTNLLARLRPLAGDLPLGVFDPANQLQPLLRTLAVEVQDLIEDGTDKFRGCLALFGPFDTKKQMRDGLAEDIRSLAKRGVAVVWLQPPPKPPSPLKPSFYTVRVGDGAVVVAQGDLVSRLAESPEAQLNLIRLAETALHPEPLDLPATRNAN